MISRKLEYIPKGGMCATCKDTDKDCSHYDFSKMPPISKGDADGWVIVKCKHFKKGSLNT